MATADATTEGVGVIHIKLLDVGCEGVGGPLEVDIVTVGQEVTHTEADCVGVGASLGEGVGVGDGVGVDDGDCAGFVNGSGHVIMRIV